MKKKVAIIGFSQLGKAHFDTIKRSPHFEVVAVYDSEDLNLAKVSVFKEIGAMLNSISVDTVILCSETYKNKELILKYMKYVKNVYVELPIFQDIETLKEVIHFKKINNLNIVVGFHDRYNPVALSLNKELAKEKEIKSINIIRGDNSNESNQDYFREFMFKNLDLIGFMTKSQIEDYIFLDNNKDDNLTCKNSIFRTQNGTLISCLTSTNYFENRLSIEILTNSAVFFADLVNLTLYKINDRGKINLKVDNEFSNLKYEQDDFFELCKNGNFKNLVKIDDLLENWESIL